MYIKQYYLGCLAHASYIIVDQKTKIAAVIDPQRDIDQYLQDAKANGWKIEHVFLTHFHADFLAGHIELRDRTGAKIYLGRRAEAEYEFIPLKDNDVIEFGDTKLQILETPGHTPEGISILAYNKQKNPTQPEAVLTGDTLFIGDVGRPDLLASIGFTANELAEMLYDSLHNKLMKLPDETLVYPAHGAGSMCGKNLSKETVSTIGEQRKFNYALQPMSKEKFIELVAADQPEAPKYFVFDAIRNRQDRPNLEEAMKQSMKPLSVDAMLRWQDTGAQIVDVRADSDYEGAHWKNAYHVALEGKYATWAGSILNPEKPIVVIAEQGEEEEAIMRLGRIGYDHVKGYLKDGMAALEQHPELVAKIERITANALVEELASDNPPTVIDVRSEKEWENGHIDGSVNIPLPTMVERLADVPKNKPFVVHCQGGYRSAIASSLLEQAGFDNFMDLVGGFKAWQTSNNAEECTVGGTCGG